MLVFEIELLTISILHVKLLTQSIPRVCLSFIHKFVYLQIIGCLFLFYIIND